jgi:hypothetical protein
MLVIAGVALVIAQSPICTGGNKRTGDGPLALIKPKPSAGAAHNSEGLPIPTGAPWQFMRQELLARHLHRHREKEGASSKLGPASCVDNPFLSRGPVQLIALAAQE